MSSAGWLRSSLILLAAASVLVLGGGEAVGAPPARPTFTLSRIQAVSLPREHATRYSVTASNVAANETPAYSWYLRLSSGAAAKASGAPASHGNGSGACTDSIVPGGTRLSATEYLWVSQGPNFTWYYGPAHSYASDPSYGCDQSLLHAKGFPGMVTVVAGNEYQHCAASFPGLVTGSTTEQGPAPTCAFGGYTLVGPSMIPVPGPLLALYHRLGVEFTELVREAADGNLNHSSALIAALQPIVRAQQAAFGRLFQPVWGCSFTDFFGDVVGAQSELQSDITLTASDRHPSGVSLTSEGRDLSSLARAAQSCEQTATRGGGVPTSVVSAVERLSAQSSALGSGAGGTEALEARLRGIETSLDSLVKTRFPAVFGIPFLKLVDETLTESAARNLAEHAAGQHDTAGIVAALKRIGALDQKIGQALNTHQKHVIKAENANA